MEKFYDSLKPGSFYILGFFDTMTHLIDNHRFLLIDDRAKIFQKSDVPTIKCNQFG